MGSEHYSLRYSLQFVCSWHFVSAPKSSEILGIDYSNGTLSAGKALKQYIMGFNIQIEVNSEVSSVHFHLIVGLLRAIRVTRRDGNFLRDVSEAILVAETENRVFFLRYP